MDINVKKKINLTFEAFYLFFIISSIQLGVGIMGAPKFIFAEAHQDSWISIILMTGYIIVILLVMLYILRQYENADIIGIQMDLFGKWIGGLLGTVYIVYFAMTLFSVIITYIEVVKVFIFPEISSFILGLILIILVVYTVLGGIRIIVGVCFLFFILTQWLLFLLIEPAMQIDFLHFQPIFGTSAIEILKGAKATSYTFIGFEIFFMLYPFIQNKEKIKLPLLLGAVWSGLIVLFTTFIAIGFFSSEQLLRREWALLALFKIQTFSFVERFDFVVVAEWMMVIVPNMVLLMWGITYSMKRVYRVPQKLSLYITAIVLLIGSTFIDHHFQIQKIIDYVAQLGFWLVYVYPLLLLPLVIIKKKRRTSGSR
ncbi:GerAB/ArcD/ProY family transporter [Oceanobacillus massiliensis]|uniref:GerAB/ArcD/ProY family transporter n=1 Tax=Oceanobacillus massiliensis TaxID=1465765 RepID=UPI00028800A9|nr:GerAB/ArcD/ProY family transporter [Oceanobacillus massiliensis]